MVIAIISVLAGLLLPALEQALEGARETKCRSNQRQIGTAAAFYANDMDGYIAPSYYDGYLWPQVLVDVPGSLHLDYLPAPPVESFASVLSCPTYAVSAEPNRFGFFGNTYFATYTYNGHAGGWHHLPENGGNDPPLLQLSRLARPAAQAHLMDGVYRHDYDTHHSTRFPLFTVDLARHHDGSHYLYFDCHAGWLERGAIDYHECSEAWNRTWKLQ